MKQLITVFLFLSLIQLSAQNNYHHFLNADRGEYQVSTQDSSGRIYMAGLHFITNFDRGFVLAEFDSNGNMVQSSNFLMSVDPVTVTMRDIRKMNNGDLYVLGDIQYGLPIPDTTFVLSFDSSFNLNWGRKFISPVGGSTQGLFHGGSNQWRHCLGRFLFPESKHHPFPQSDRPDGQRAVESHLGNCGQHYANQLS